MAKHPEHVLLEGVVPFPEHLAQLYREKGYWRGETIADMLFNSVERYFDRIAVIDGAESVTYAQLGQRVLSLSRGFQELGIGRFDRVVVQLPNVAAYFEVVFALFELGAVPVFALAAHRKAEIEYFCSFSEAKGGADKKLDTPVSGLESACTRWRPGSSPWRPSRRGSA